MRVNGTKSPMNTLVMGLREWALLVLLSVIWGGSFFFNEVALTAFGPFTVVFGRVSLAAAALLVYISIRGYELPKSKRVWGAFIIIGAINNTIPFSLIVWGQTHIDGGLASILNATTPLFTVVLAHFLTVDERMTPAKVAGILLGIIGVAVLIGPGSLQAIDGPVLGKLAILGASLTYGLAGIFGRRMSGYPPSVAATGMLICASLMTLPMMLVLEAPMQATPSLAAIGAVIGIALICTSAAYLLYFHILAKAGATNLLLVTFLIPATALMLGVTILGEPFTINALIGLGLILSGLAAIDGRIIRLLRKT